MDEGEPNIVVLKQDPKHYDYLFKVILVGDTGVGKTCLIWRGVRGLFKERYDVTICCEFSPFVAKINDKVLKLQIWDTCGQEAQRSMTKVFYKGANCAVLVYDLTRKETFRHLDGWIHDVRDNAKADVTLMLVGNMADLAKQRQVPESLIMQLEQSERIAYRMETSAKTGEGVDKLFAKCAQVLLQNIQRESTPTAHTNGTVLVAPPAHTHKSSCKC